MYPLVASNAILFSLSSTLRSILNSGHWFKLYSNDLTPTPATMRNEFIECGFAGYAPFNLAGQFAAPLKFEDGIYTLNAQTGLFGCEKGTQTVYGGYIDDGLSVKFSQRFLAPIVMVPGSSFVVPVAVSVFSLSLFAV